MQNNTDRQLNKLRKIKEQNKNCSEEIKTIKFNSTEIMELKNTTAYCLQDTHIGFMDTHRQKMKGW